MLQFIQDITNKLLEFIKDDPVRPEISKEFRVSNGRAVAALVDEEENPEAMVCVSFHDFVPENIECLNKTTQVPTVVTFYTVWSYRPGAGRDILLQAMSHIKKHYPSVTTFVTLSPPTEMAKRFHLKNGAKIYRVNKNTINYLYS